MTEHILPSRVKYRRSGHGIAASQAAIIASLVSLSAGADRPCPPQLETSDGVSVISGGQVCPVSQAGVSDTPDYDDPMKSCTGLGGRRVVNVANVSALQQAMTNASCGDTIKLAPGNYGAAFSIAKECPMASPVIIQGAANFESTVTANFSVKGARTIVTGIKFSGPDARLRLGGTNNKVIANTFTDWRGVAVTAESGKHGEIAYNEFSRPHPWLASEANAYPLRIGIRTAESDPSNFHFDAWVHSNYFHDFPEKPNPASYHSGQSDAIEVCQSGRSSTALMLSGWYIESNLIERHKQGHGIVDFKCGGNVARYNTVLDSPKGRIDARAGSYNVIESNWMENSGGSTIHGGYNKIVGNHIRDGQITVMAGEFEWNLAGGGYPRAYNTLLAGNDASALYIGKSYSAAMQYPALDTIVEAHVGPEPVLDKEDKTTIKPSTSVKFSAPFKLSPGSVGPAALSGASAPYLTCRLP